MGEVEKGLAKLDGAIAALEGERHFDEMDACIIALKRKIHVLNQLGREEEVVSLAKRIVEDLADYRQHPTDYADDSYRRPTTDESIQDYCTFYTSQAHGFLANAYGEIGAADSARRYLALFGQSDYAQTKNGRFIAATAYGLLGNYGRMLSLFDEVFGHEYADTLWSDYATMLHWRARAAEAEGNYRVANAYLHRYSALKQEQNVRLLKSRAYEYAARYQLQEEQMNTERERARADRIRNQAVMLLILALISVAAVVWLTIQQRAIKRKNRVLAEQIAKRVESVKMKVESDAAIPGMLSTNRDDLFAYLDQTIRMEQLYLDNMFGRQAIMDRFHLDERRVGATFAKAGGVPIYVRRLRVEYACSMISEHPEMSLVVIAVASHFSQNRDKTADVVSNDVVEGRIEPFMGYNINERWRVGLTVGYQFDHTKQLDATTGDLVDLGYKNTFRVGPYVHFNVVTYKRWTLFLEAEAIFGHSPKFMAMNAAGMAPGVGGPGAPAAAATYDVKRTEFTFTIKPGISFELDKHVNIDFNLNLLGWMYSNFKETRLDTNVETSSTSNGLNLDILEGTLENYWREITIGVTFKF